MIIVIIYVIYILYMNILTLSHSFLRVIGQPHAGLAQRAALVQLLTNIADMDHVLGNVRKIRVIHHLLHPPH